ncbi:RICIN domain-containing protein [Pendulispora brunnea]|uniref:RICIN domain-containing protein n=1 Tax=Pendulispora brunnea TaxID=2905690 RepID=A0ABZ2KHI4_9BACT
MSVSACAGASSDTGSEPDGERVPGEGPAGTSLLSQEGRGEDASGETPFTIVEGPALMSASSGNDGEAHASGEVHAMGKPMPNVIPWKNGSKGWVTSGMIGKCLDINGQNTANGTKVQIWECNGTIAQRVTLGSDKTLRVLGKCVDVPESRKVRGTLLHLWDCNGSPGQKWEVRGVTLVNPNSGLCMDVPNVSSQNGTQLEIWDCAPGARNQVWTVPIGDEPGTDIRLDTSNASDLGWFGAMSKNIALAWYGKFSWYLSSSGYKAPSKWDMIFKECDGVAYVSGTTATGCAKFFREHGDDFGAMVHESVHIIQQYRGNTPGWVTEGIADFMRYYIYQPYSVGRPARDAHYTQGYGEAAWLFNYIVRSYDSSFVRRLNEAARNGTYSDDIFKTVTPQRDKTLDGLWAEAQAQP